MNEQGVRSLRALVTALGLGVVACTSTLADEVDAQSEDLRRRPRDHSPPTAPASLHQTAATTDSVTVAWSPATDNVGVIAYDAFLGDPLAPVTHAGLTPTALFTQLACGTTYPIGIAARDAAGNVSPVARVDATTAPCVTAPPPPPPPPPPPSTNDPLAKQLWPNVFGRAGSYGGADTDAAEVDAMHDVGLTLEITNYRGDGNTGNATNDAFIQKTRAYGQKYIDIFPWSAIWFEACHGTQPCNPDDDPTMQNAILQSVDAHLAAVANDASIAGFWTLDDNLGSMQHTITLIRQHIQAANGAAVFPRPTLCGFGGGLDMKWSAGDTVFHPNHDYFDNAVANYSPDACDIAVLYPYGWILYDAPQPETGIDWSMTDSLPYMLGKLRTLGMQRAPGWDPSSLVWFGLAQTFGAVPYATGRYVTPTYDAVMAQARAYCSHGAAAYGIFSWHSLESGLQEVWNSDPLKQAVRDAVTYCQSQW